MKGNHNNEENGPSLSVIKIYIFKYIIAHNVLLLTLYVNNKTFFHLSQEKILPNWQ